MALFQLSDAPLDTAGLAARARHEEAGGYASFEGWVRRHNDGREVAYLEYEAYAPLAMKLGNELLGTILQRPGIISAHAVHRTGRLAVGDIAVWVGVSAVHRAEAFAAARDIIDTVKHRVPIWKKEHFSDGAAQWTRCEACAAPPQEAGHDYAHPHPVRVA